GNAGEFLDPVFSSGVTIAMQSAIMAAPLVIKTLNGETVDWENEFSQPLRQGISTFKTFVEGWYNGDLRNIIFYPNPDSKIKRMVCSVLAGYAWDSDNPLVKHSKRRLKALAESCEQ
ncbi:MAG: FAD-dependent oxidoreductase, partial [Psychrosphaera sp.]|nr:FAD-dependent oxidoreductase [Psychrosphaera sp.]